MNYINELVELAQQLDSVMDDSRSVFSNNPVYNGIPLTYFC